MLTSQRYVTEMVMFQSNADFFNIRHHQFGILWQEHCKEQQISSGE